MDFGKLAALFFEEGYMAGVNSSLTLKILFVHILFDVISINIPHQHFHTSRVLKNKGYSVSTPPCSPVLQQQIAVTKISFFIVNSMQLNSNCYLLPDRKEYRKGESCTCPRTSLIQMQA
jgi:hypothetical protein